MLGIKYTFKPEMVFFQFIFCTGSEIKDVPEQQSKWVDQVIPLNAEFLWRLYIYLFWKVRVNKCIEVVVFNK